MTNEDYIKNRLSDHDLIRLFMEGSIFYKDGFLGDVNKVFCYWRSFGFTSNGNVQENGNIPSIWNWRKTKNPHTGEWEITGRTREVSFLVFLSKQYDETYWKEAIKGYDNHWKKEKE